MTESIKHKIQVFEYFKMLHPDIANGTVLDYGSGYGKFLYTSNGEFPQENYTALDVIYKDVLEEGKKFFPRANFVHYNGYNIVCNKTGVKGLRPVLKDQYYDTIVSYATVPVCTTLKDSLETIDWLYGLLRPGGKLLLTWLDVDDQVATDHYHKKRTEKYGSCDTIKANDDDYVYLCDNRLSKIADCERQILLFFKAKYLSSLLKHKHSLAPSRPDIGCVYSCIIMEK